MPFPFGRKKRLTPEQQRKKTNLEQLIGDDKETYDALAQVMFLDPRKISTPIKQVVDNAKKSEKDKDMSMAGMWYEVAAGLSLYEGNVKKIVEYYNEAKRVTGREYFILKNPEKAVVAARQYYEKYLQT